MSVIEFIFDYILGLGAEVFVPGLMIIIGLIVGMKFREAFNAGVILGVAFIGMNLVIGFMLSALTPAAQDLAEMTGIDLTAVDGGWTTAATLSWAWPFAFLVFPIQLIINGVMLVFKWTKTLNVDLWNVWGKIFTAVAIMFVTDNLYIALVGASIIVVIELLLSDLNQSSIEEVTGIPGVTVSHGMNIFAVTLMPLDWVLRRFKFFNKKMDANALREKIGVFAENNIMGFIIGLLLAFAAGYSIGNALVLAMQAAAALTLFPMIAKLFMEALSPLSEAINDFMKKRFKDREMFIGLDWPILAGSSEVWVAIILTVPFTLILSFILPGNAVLPFAGILNIGLAVSALIVTSGNLFRMVVLSILTTPIYLYVATYFTDIITDLARTTGAVAIEEGQRLTWSTVEYPVIRYILTELGQFTFLGIILAIVWVGLFLFYRQQMSKRNKTVGLSE